MWIYLISIFKIYHNVFLVNIFKEVHLQLCKWTRLNDSTLSLSRPLSRDLALFCLRSLSLSRALSFSRTDRCFAAFCSRISICVLPFCLLFPFWSHTYYLFIYTCTYMCVSVCVCVLVLVFALRVSLLSNWVYYFCFPLPLALSVCVCFYPQLWVKVCHLPAPCHSFCPNPTGRQCCHCGRRLKSCPDTCETHSARLTHGIKIMRN